MAGGLGLFGAIGYMQANDKAVITDYGIDLPGFVSPEVPVRNAVPALAPEPSVSEAHPAEMLVLPPVQIRALPTRASQASTGAVAAPAAVAVPSPHEAEVPCSPWRQIGPRNVNDGVPSGAVHVRQLC
jgi:hypothetical protein